MTKDTIVIYEVCRSTPLGDCSMGYYNNYESANQHKCTWNLTHDGLDTAYINSIELKNEYSND